MSAATPHQRHTQPAKPSSMSESERVVSSPAASWSTKLKAPEPNTRPFRWVMSMLNSRFWHIGLLAKRSAMPLGSVSTSPEASLLLNSLIAARRFSASRAFVRDCSLFGSTGGRAAARPAFARIGAGIDLQSPSSAMLSMLTGRLCSNVGPPGPGSRRCEAPPESTWHTRSRNHGLVNAAAAAGLTSGSFVNKALNVSCAMGDTL
mmetsp:Transcript_30779/g.89384  ORF Transcript_30779/g.89384 Transcript_30779/m.89384 type:complete len:205 (-) Transcript_30779:885-1499(-)